MLQVINNTQDLPESECPQGSCKTVLIYEVSGLESLSGKSAPWICLVTFSSYSLCYFYLFRFTLDLVPISHLWLKVLVWGKGKLGRRFFSFVLCKPFQTFFFFFFPFYNISIPGPPERLKSSAFPIPCSAFTVIILGKFKFLIMVLWQYRLKISIFWGLVKLPSIGSVNRNYS